MAASEGNVSLGIVVDFDAKFAGEMTDIDKSTEVTDMADVSHQASPDMFREFKAGLTNGGTVTIGLNVNPDHTLPDNGEEGTLTITVPWSGVTAVKMTAQALVAEKGSFNGPLGDKVSGEITFQIASKPVWAAAP